MLHDPENLSRIPNQYPIKLGSRLRVDSGTDNSGVQAILILHPGAQSQGDQQNHFPAISRCDIDDRALSYC